MRVYFKAKNVEKAFDANIRLYYLNKSSPKIVPQIGQPGTFGMFDPNSLTVEYTEYTNSDLQIYEAGQDGEYSNFYTALPIKDFNRGDEYSVFISLEDKNRNGNNPCLDSEDSNFKNFMDYYSQWI